MTQDKKKPNTIRNYETLFAAIKKEFPDASSGIHPGSERSVQLRVSAHDRLGMLEISWGIRKGIINFVQFFPIEVSDQNRTQLLKKVAEINATLAVLGFVIDDQSIRFMTHAFLDEDGTTPPEIVVTTIRQCQLMFEMFIIPLHEASQTN